MKNTCSVREPISPQINAVLHILFLLLCVFPGTCNAEEYLPEMSNTSQTSRSMLPSDIFGSYSDYESDDVYLLSRQRRETNDTTDNRSVWQKLEDFYADKNNMAMFCVLPILVIVYGGCSAIYCIYKCRQYVKKRKHKKLKEEDSQSVDTLKTDLDTTTCSQEELSQERDRPVSQISSAWTDLQVDEAGWSGLTEGKPLEDWSSSPLPWSVPCRSEARVASANSKKMARAGYLDDSLRNDDIGLAERNINSSIANSSVMVVRNAMSTSLSGKNRISPTASDRNTISSSVSDSDINRLSSTASDRNTISSSVSDINRISSCASDIVLGHGHRSETPVDHETRSHTEPFLFQPATAKPSATQHPLYGEPRPLANLAEYASSRSPDVQAASYSKFTDSRPIEIIPLSADPNLRLWDPLHNKPFCSKDQSQIHLEIASLGALSEKAHVRRPNGKSSRELKEELMAKYDAFSTFQMAKRAAEILNSGATDKNRQQQKKPKKKKNIAIAE